VKLRRILDISVRKEERFLGILDISVRKYRRTVRKVR
jgi:hypothetical protein